MASSGFADLLAQAREQVHALDVTLFARRLSDLVVVAQGGAPEGDCALAALRHRTAALHVIGLGAPFIRRIDESGATAAPTIAAVPAASAGAVVGALVVTVERRPTFAERRALMRLGAAAGSLLHATMRVGIAARRC